MDEDTLYEERRMEELEYVRDYFLYHIYRIQIPAQNIRSMSDWKQGDKYIIEMTLKPNNAKFTLEIPRDFYNKVDLYVSMRDTYTLKFEEIDEKLEKEVK